MPSAWETLQGLPAWRVVTIPRPSTAQDPGTGPHDPLAAQRLAALTAAYHTGRAVAFGWIRDSVGGPVQVLTAGPALAAWSDRGAALLTLPAATLRAMDTRLRDCALAHAVDAAAAARVAVIASRVSVPGLAAHVTAAMRAALDERRWLCQRAEPAYLAPCYRWALVLDGLRTCDRKDSSAGPHPDSAAWAGIYGRAIPGDTCAQQLAAVERWFEADQRDAAVVQAVAFGTGDPAAVERAAGARRVDEDWDSRLADVLGEFRDCRWAADYLRPN